MLFRHDDDMPLGGGRVGRKRDGVLGFDPDSTGRDGAERAGAHDRQHNTRHAVTGLAVSAQL